MKNLPHYSKDIYNDDNIDKFILTLLILGYYCCWKQS